VVFGYYDIRSHKQSKAFGTGSQELFRCGSDGTIGCKKCVAPTYSYGNQIKKYIEKIAKIHGTWCVFKNGSTPVYKMNRVKRFFKVRTVFTILYMY